MPHIVMMVLPLRGEAVYQPWWMSKLSGWDLSQRKTAGALLSPSCHANVLRSSFDLGKSRYVLDYGNVCHVAVFALGDA